MMFLKLTASITLLGAATVATAQTSDLQADLERIAASVGGSVGVISEILRAGLGECKDTRCGLFDGRAKFIRALNLQ